jgi:hypothetical protein
MIEANPLSKDLVHDRDSRSGAGKAVIVTGHGTGLSERDHARQSPVPFMAIVSSSDFTRSLSQIYLPCILRMIPQGEG